jgi:DNA-binding protein WhiA
LEYVVADEEVAHGLALLLRAYELNAKIMRRKGMYVVYLKGSEHIVTLLTLIGATSALLELENIRSLRELRNDVNRAVNCETANIQKTSLAAQRQLEAIQSLERTGAFRELSTDLRHVAELRMEYPEATLDELAAMIPGLSKSGVNHRLRRLCLLAKQAEENRRMIQ